MKNLTIAQALRRKNELVQQINQTKALITTENAKVVATEDSVPHFEYDMSDLLSKYDKLVMELITVKVALDHASLPIREKIYALAELKAKLKTYSAIPTKHGIVPDYRGNQSIIKIQYYKSDIDSDLTQFQKGINTLQDEIAEFNHNTLTTI